MAEGKFISVTPILRHYGQLIIDALKKNLEGHTASFQLQQSIDFSVSIFGSVYTMSIQMNDYWRWVEFGRRAGKFPPLDPIIKWTAQKGFDIRDSLRGDLKTGKIVSRIQGRNRLLFKRLVKLQARQLYSKNEFTKQRIQLKIDKLIDDISAQEDLVQRLGGSAFGTRTRKSFKEMADSKRRSIAFAIARKISRKGTPATHFASKTLGMDFIQSGALTAPIWFNLINDLQEAIGKQVTIEVINFKK